MVMIIKDEAVFSDWYLPRKLLFREREMGRVLEFLKENWSSGISPVVILHGKVGVGKTALARKILEEVGEEKTLRFYADGISEDVNTETKILKKLLRRIWGTASLEGISSGEVASLLANALRTKGIRAVLVVDEAPNVLSRGSEAFSYLVSQEKCGGMFSLLLCTLETNWVYSYLDFAKETETLEIPLKGFRKSQLFEIVKERAKLGLVQGSYSEEILDFVADLASSEGTPRAAIKILYYAAKIAEKNGREEILPEDVRKASEEIPESTSLSKIYSLDLPAKLILLAAYLLLRERPYIKFPEILSKANELMQIYLGKGQISRTKANERLKWIVKMGLLQERKENRKRLYEVNFPIELLIERLSEVLEREGEGVDLY